MEYTELSINNIVHSRYSAGHVRAYDRDTFNELVKSVRCMGVYKPICVTGKNSAGQHVIIDGDHRFEAAKEAGLETVPVLIDSTVDPDKGNYREKALNYINNMQRVNLTTYEAATLFRQMFRDCNFEELEEAKAIMGISRNRAELFNKLNVLDADTAEWLERRGMDSSRGVVDGLLAIKDIEDRKDAISRAEVLDISEQREMVDFLKSAGMVLNCFSRAVSVHFNGNELPYTSAVIRFLQIYETDKDQLKAVEKLNAVSPKERTEAAGEFVRLLEGVDPGTGEIKPERSCPELENTVLDPAFPHDAKTIDAIIRFRSVFPEEPGKRSFIISDLLARGRLAEDDLILLTRAVEKFFISFPGEVQAFFWDGTLPFSDACFRILAILLEKTYDLPTKIEMIHEASAGKASPEQFENRLGRAMRERDDMISEIARQTGADPAELKNDADIMRSAGMPEEDIERIRNEKKTPAAAAEYSAEEPGDYAEEDDTPSGEDDRDLILLADSMSRSLGTDKLLELELLDKGENESIRLSKLYCLAEKICKGCRKERIFGFDTVNYCNGCMMARLIGEVEDSVGED